MRKLSIALLSAAFVLLGAVVSQAAAPIVGGSFQIRLSGLPPLGLGANLAGSIAVNPGTVIENANEFGPANIDLPDSLFTGVPQISDLRINGLGKPAATSTLTNFGGGLQAGIVGGNPGAVAGVNGTATICVFACAGLQVAIPLTLVGAGGALFTTALYQPLTVTAATGWTTGAAVITGINSQVNSTLGLGTCIPVTCSGTQLVTGTGNGVYVSTVTLSGSNNLTASGNGTITLVTPVITKSLAGNLPLYGIQTLVFLAAAPEPGTLLLLGSGIAGLVALGTRRARR